MSTSRVIKILCLCLLSFGVKAQLPVNRGPATIQERDARLQGYLNLVAPRYADTTAANTQKGLDSLGAIIYTDLDTTLWIRGVNEIGTKTWRLLRGTGGSSGGTYTADETTLHKSGANVFNLITPIPSSVTWNGVAIGTTYGGAPVGGTTGQVLTKINGTNYNYSWQTPSSGFADPLTTNGDIIARISGSTTRLPKGSDGTFLSVQSGLLQYYTPGLSDVTNWLGYTAVPDSRILTINGVALDLSTDRTWTISAGVQNLTLQNGLYALNDSTIEAGTNPWIHHTHFSGSDLYNTYFDSTFLYYPRHPALAVDSSTFALMAWNKSTGQLRPMSWPTFGSGGGFNEQQPPLGVIYQKNSWTTGDLAADFTQSGGITASIVSNKIQISGGAGTYTQLLKLNGSTYLEHRSFCVKIKVGTISGSPIEFGIGAASSNSYLNASTVAHMTYVTGSVASPIALDLLSGTWSNFGTTTGTVSASTGDYILLTYKSDFPTATLSARNMTTGATQVDSIFSAGGGGNTSNLSIYSFGGTFTIDSISVTSTELTNANALFIGDSKTQGAITSAYNKRFTSILGNYVKSIVDVGAGGDRTTDWLARLPEIISLNPKQVYLTSPSNDLRSGMTEATSEAQYDTLSARLLRSGTDVYYCLPFFETSENQSLMRAHILATYPSNKIIDTWAPMTVSGTLSGDGIHPNDIGHAAIALAIINANKLNNFRYQGIAAASSTSGGGGTGGNIPLDSVLKTGNSSARTMALTGYNPTGSMLQVGKFHVLSLSSDVSILTNNTTFNGSSFIYDTTTAVGSSGISFGNGTIDFKIFGAGTTGGAALNYNPMQIGEDLGVGIGSNITTGVYPYTGASMVVMPAKIHIYPRVLQTGTGSDSLLVWHSGDSALYAVAQNSITAGPAGSNTQIQWNHSGVMAGSNYLLNDTTNLGLIVGAGSVGSRLTMNYGTGTGGNFVYSLAGTIQFIEGHNNLAGYGGTTGVSSGRAITTFDNITSTLIEGISSAGHYWGPSNTNYNLFVSRANSGIAGAQFNANGELITVASTTTTAGLNIPSGTAPTSPVAGDVWSDGTYLATQNGLKLFGATSAHTTKIRPESGSNGVSIINDDNLVAFMNSDLSHWWQFSPTAGGNLLMIPNTTHGLLGITGNIQYDGLKSGVLTISAGGGSIDINHVAFVYTGGSIGTTTLPPEQSSTVNGQFIYLKNRGSAIWTIAAAGSDHIYTSTSVTSFTIAPGASAILYDDGSFWIQQ